MDFAAYVRTSVHEKSFVPYGSTHVRRILNKFSYRTFQGEQQHHGKPTIRDHAIRKI